MRRDGELGRVLLALPNPLTRADVLSRLGSAAQHVDVARPDIPLVRACRERGFDIAVIDVALGAEVRALLRARENKTPTIIGLVTDVRPVTDRLAELVHLGIDGIVTVADDLAASVRAVGERRVVTSWVSPILAAVILADYSGARSTMPESQHGEMTITPAQRRVLRLVADGNTDHAIASSLGRKERTVKYHLHALYGKLDARNRAHLVSRAAELGLLTAECPNGQGSSCSNDTGQVRAFRADYDSLRNPDDSGESARSCDGRNPS